MKSGASDPFAEDESPEPDDEPDNEPDDDVVDRGEPDTSRGSENATTPDPVTAGSDDSADEAADDESEGSGISREELPFVLRRDKVKDERPEVHQLFVQAETHEEAVDAERELEDMLGVDLSRTDAREAIYLAGMQHLDEAADVLRRWGYDI